MTVGASPGVATQQTYAPGDGWMEVAPDAQGMDPASLEAARDYAFQPDRHTQGVVITRGGEIVTAQTINADDTSKHDKEHSWAQ